MRNRMSKDTYKTVANKLENKRFVECIDYNLTKETRLEMEMVSDMRVILIKGSILQ